MRARSGLTFVLALALTAVAPIVSAHRTEDYLQAVRLGLEPDRVLITLDLSPGIAEAEPFIAAVDRDHDGLLSTEEQRGYVQQVMGALAVESDDHPLQPRVLTWNFPDLSAIRRGEGAMRLEIQAALPIASAGSHRLYVKNAHLAGHSAYLANALVPGSARLKVTAQRRDRDQSELTIEYTVQADPAPAPLAWVLGGLAAALAKVGSRWARAS